MDALLRFTQPSTNEIVLTCVSGQNLNALLVMLDQSGIAFVEQIPARTGLFCVPLGNAYRVFQSVWNAEDNVFNNYMVYTLTWIPLPPAAPVLVREEPYEHI